MGLWYSESEKLVRSFENQKSSRSAGCSFGHRCVRARLAAERSTGLRDACVHQGAAGIELLTSRLCVVMDSALPAGGCDKLRARILPRLRICSVQVTQHQEGAVCGRGIHADPPHQVSSRCSFWGAMDVRPDPRKAP